MNKNLLISLIAIAVIIGGGWFLFRDKLMPAPAIETIEQVVPSSPPAIEATPTGSETESSGSSLEGTKEFTVTGSNFKFDTSEIKVKKGDTVKITFKNSSGFHNFAIDEFNISTKQMSGPSEETVTFVADKVGTYEFYCAVGNHRAMGMKGKFIVE